MRREVVFLFSMVFMMSFISAACDLDVSLLNQDPYPAVPGEELEVVFTISNIDSTECGTVEFEIVEEYPFSVTPGFETKYVFQSGTFLKNRNTQKTIPVDYIVDENALDGDVPLEVLYRDSAQQGDGFFSQTFDIKIEDVKVDFEIFVSDYNYATKEMTFDVLNIGKADIEAVTVEIPNQKGVKVYGSNRENIGDLSSNEDTSSEFKLDIEESKISLIISYSDSIQVRRTIEKEVVFDASLFENTKETGNTNYWMWIVIAAIVVIIAYFYRKRRKKKKRS